MTRIRAALLLILLGLGAAGCGGSDDGSEEFVQGYNAAMQRLTSIVSEVDRAAGKTNKQIAKEFDQLADRTAQARTELSELAPPEDARDEFETLLRTVREGIRQLRAVAEAARSSDPEAARAAGQRLAETGREIDEAETALREAVEG